MNRLLMTVALTGVLSISAAAGDMSTADSPATAPGGTPHGTSTSPTPAPSAAGDMSTADAAQPLADGMLSALLSVLGLVG